MGKAKTKSNLSAITEPAPGAVKTAVIFDAAKFDEMQGETFAGLNVLKLKKGEAAGPIEITEILLQQKLGKGKAAAKRKPVDVYCGKVAGVACRLPCAASLVMKMKEAKVAVGDTVAIKRLDDYETAFGNPGASYHLKVLARAE